MQINRIFRIVYYLLEHGKSSAPELAKKFEVSTRTIYRDFDTISAAGIPIYTTQGKGGGVSLLEDYVLDRSLFSEKEQEQILMALQGIAATKDERAAELLTKLSALFPVKNPDWIEVDFSGWNKNEADQVLFDEIKKAIFDRHMIAFSYFGSNGQRSFRQVKPVKLVFKSRDWYLYGFCLLKKGYRFFKLTRIKNLVTSAETFPQEAARPPEIKTDMPEYSTIPVTLKFSPKVAFRVYDEFAGSVKTDKENNLYVTAELPDNEIMYCYLFTFLDNVEVLAPASVRETMKEKINAIVNNYKT